MEGEVFVGNSTNVRQVCRSSGKEVQEVESVSLEHVLAARSVELELTGNAHAELLRTRTFFKRRWCYR